MNITVKDFLRHNPNAMLDLMTPEGLIQLTPDRGQWLLTKNGANARIKVTGTQEVVVGSDLLSQIVYKIVPYRNRRNQIFLPQTPRQRQRKAHSGRTLNTSK